jgi:hypothetical protein
MHKTILMVLLAIKQLMNKSWAEAEIKSAVDAYLKLLPLKEPKYDIRRGNRVLTS